MNLVELVFPFSCAGDELARTTRTTFICTGVKTNSADGILATQATHGVHTLVELPGGVKMASHSLMQISV